MTEAILFGLAASSALVIGGVVGSFWEVPRLIKVVLLAFATGALISALAIELFGKAVDIAGAGTAGMGLLAGTVTFIGLDTWLDRRVPEPKGRKERGGAGGIGLPLLAAVTLDGIPENAALGVSLVDQASLTLLVAIFFSNLPESLVGANEMRREGHSARFAIGIWAVAAVLLALAVVVGRAMLDGVGDHTLAFLLAYAGGAVLASLADTLMPEAFARHDPLPAFACGAGFFLSYVIAG
jgi:ZIP family zinc transporter